MKQIIEYVEGIDPIIEIHAHGNKETCNKNMMEINPTVGCQFQCQYCNAYTQEKEDNFSKVKVYIDYPKYLEDYLQKNKEDLGRLFFYFSPKIDAFQDCLLESEITKQILELLKKYNARYIIVTKGKIPPKEISDLLVESKSINQILSSCSMPNEKVRQIIEPNAASIQERLDFAKFCVENGIPVTAIFSPIFPVDNLKFIKDYIRSYLDIGITHFRVNFAEISRNSLVKMIELLPEYKDELIKTYLVENAEQTYWKVPYKDIEMSRYFPSIEYMKDSFDGLREFAKEINPKATFSVCNSLCIENKLHKFNDEAIKAGFGCIGYRW